MAKKTVEEIAEVAANWWAEKIVKPRFNMGASSPQEMLAEVMATVMAKNNIDDELKTKFIESLKNKIISYLENHKTMCIDVDYSPCEVLYRAMEDAGIPSNNAPWKTVMWISKTEGEVSVKYGYGAGVTIL